MTRRAAPRLPALVDELELTGPWPPVEDLARHEVVYLLLRLGGEPVGRLHLESPGITLGQGGLPAAIESSLAGAPLERFRSLRARREDPAAPGEGADQPGRDAAAVEPDHPFATVVVPTRNRPGDLDNCLSSLARQRYRGFEVIVVDSAGAPGVAQGVVDRWSGRIETRIIREENPGLSLARNRGLAMARGEFVAFLDDDCRADAGWLGAIASALGLTGCGAVTGPMLPAELGTRAQRLFLRYTYMDRRGFDRVVFGPRGEAGHDGIVRLPSKVWPVDSWRIGGGGNMALRRVLIPRVGGFDESLGAGTPAHGGEDLMILHKLVDADQSVCFEPRAVVWHRHWREMGQLRGLLFRHGAGHTAYLLACWRERLHRQRLVRYEAGFLLNRVSRLAASLVGARRYDPSLPLCELAGSLGGIVLAGRSRMRARRAGIPGEMER